MTMIAYNEEHEGRILRPCPDFPVDGPLVPCDRTRTLVVDDEQGVAALFCNGIAKAMPHVKVDRAVNGKAAVEAFCADHHGVLIMDVNMPVMDGLRAFRCIEDHCHRQRWEMPSVLFCTCYAPSGQLQRALADVRHGLLLKPVSGQDVAEAVKSRLSRSAKTRVHA